MALVKKKTGLDEVDRVLEPVWDELTKLGKVGAYITVALVAATPYRVAHGLRRPWKRWWLTRSTATSPVYEVNVTTTDKSKEIWLQSAADANVEVYLV